MDQINILKYKVGQYRYLDYEMFLTEIQDFNKHNKAIKGKGIGISKMQTKALFLLLDEDESGELESDEILGVLEDRMMLGRNKEIEARDEAIETAKKYLKKAEAFLREATGYYWIPTNFQLSLFKH